MFEINAWTVLLMASLTAVATGLGVLPFVFVRDLSRWWVSISNGLAAGLMLAACHGLIVEGARYSPERLILGMLIGLALIWLIQGPIERRDGVEVAELVGAGARKALIILGVMTAHSFAEGVGVGVAFGGTEELGLFVSIAIAIHNIPEGLVISLVLVPRGTPLLKASGWSVFSSLPQPLMAVPAFFFVQAFRPFLPVGLGLAAGAMIWMVFAELMPDALEDASSRAVGVAVVVAFTALWAFQHLVLSG